MEKRLTVEDYLGLPETNTPQELVYGILREPPAPAYGHQAVVTWMAAAIGEFVRRKKLGEVCVSPVDVVLDRERALVVQPDIVFVSTARTQIISDRVWGAPDLVIEVLSPRTANRDRSHKLEWYRRYGVKEAWLVDDRAVEVTVVRLDAGAEARQRSYRRLQRIYSRVLPGFRPSAARLVLSGSKACR